MTDPAGDATHTTPNQGPREPQHTAATGGGRPTLFTEALAGTICIWVAETSMGLRKICRELGLCYSTVSKWTLPGSTTYRAEFREQYLAAKVQQADVLAEEILEIADDMAADTITQADGKVVQNRVHIARCKLRISVRQWLMGRLAPKRWGNKPEGIDYVDPDEGIPHIREVFCIGGKEYRL